MNPPALKLSNLSVGYPGSPGRILSNLELTLAPGARVALLGLNGSGKTTLLSAVVGLVPHQGSIRVGDLPVERKNLREIRRNTGFLFNVPEDQLLFSRVGDDVAFGLVQRGVPPREAEELAAGILGQLGLEGFLEKEPHSLSHGQKLRVALAGVLVTNPNLLLLDEPSSGLDPRSRNQLASFLKTRTSAMLIATHDLDFAARCCESWVYLQDGVIKDRGTDFTAGAGLLE